MSEPEDAAPETTPEAKLLHDMRQPLAAVLAAASALKTNPAIDDETRERLASIIVTNAERLSEMLTEVFGRP